MIHSLDLGHTIKFFRKKCSWSCYSGCVWHMTRLKHGNQHAQHPKKHGKQPETRKQVSQTVLANGWQKIQGSKQREIELISKSLKKEKMLRLRSWLLLHVKKYKSCCWRALVIRKCNIARYLDSGVLVDMIMMMKRLCTYWPTINKQTSLNKPTSEQKLLKK